MAAITEYRANLTYVRRLIRDGARRKPANAEDVFRSAYVMAVSALDRYMHEKTLAEMLAVHSGTRPATAAFEQFKVSLGVTRQGIAAALSPPVGVSPDTWLASAIATAHELKTFQRPDAIAEAVSLFSAVRLWDRVALRLATRGTRAQIVTRLRLIAHRRNQIVHEFDCDPANPGGRHPMDVALVTDAADFLSDVVESIEAVV